MWSESCSVISDSLWPHGLYSPWNSPGQNTGIGSFSFLQRIFPTQGLNPGLPNCRRILYQLSHKGSPKYAAATAAKSLQSFRTLCDPIDGSPPGSPSLGFSKQEHWSGLPFPSPMHESEKWKWSRSVMSNSWRPHGLQPTRLLRPNTLAVSCVMNLFGSSVTSSSFRLCLFSGPPVLSGLH